MTVTTSAGRLSPAHPRRLEDAAELLAERDATREYIPDDPRSSARWHEHGWPSPYCRWNYHPEYEIHLIRCSSGRYIVGDRVGTFEPGQLVLVGPYVPHQWVTESTESAPLRDAVFQFRHEWLAACREALPEIAELDELIGWSARGILFGGDAARDGAAELERIGRTSGTTRLAHIFALLATLAAAPPAERELLAGECTVWRPDEETEAVLERIFAYIFDNIDGDVRLSAAAELAGMSETAFSRYFVRASGTTFSTMVRDLRMAEACRLLRRTRLPVAAIAFRVGYRNLSNFNRQFLRGHDLTPSDYRRSHREAV